MKNNEGYRIMFKKLNEVENRYEDIEKLLQKPDTLKNQNQYLKLMKEYAQLEKIILIYRQYKKLQKDIQSCKELLQTEKEDLLKKMAKEDLLSFENKCKKIESQLQQLLLPQDPHENKNIIIEIRAGAGGDESSLFAEELFRAYNIFASAQNWSIQIISASPGNAGGLKEVLASCSGKQVYSRLKYESGVHRVQRVPKTESQGRIHTSTVTVVILPEAEEVDITIASQDIRIDVYRSSGHGGQSVNTTDSAVRVTHLPTGITVTCQDGKSQHSNKQQALKVLYSRLYSLEQEKIQEKASQQRLSQIGTGDRSERIRTYNFPQNRITDHRIGMTTHTLTHFMNGDMSEVIDSVRTYYQTELLKQQNS